MEVGYIKNIEEIKELISDLYYSFQKDINIGFIVNNNEKKKYIFKSGDQINIYEPYFAKMDDKVKFKRTMLFLKDNKLEAYDDEDIQIYFEDYLVQLTYKDKRRETIEALNYTVLYTHEDIEKDSVTYLGFTHQFYDDNKTIIGYNLLNRPLYVFYYDEKRNEKYKLCTYATKFLLYNYHELKEKDQTENLNEEFYINNKHPFKRTYSLEEVKNKIKFPEIDSYLINLYNKEYDEKLKEAHKIIDLALEYEKNVPKENVYILFEN